MVFLFFVSVHTCGCLSSSLLSHKQRCIDDNMSPFSPAHNSKKYDAVRSSQPVRYSCWPVVLVREAATHPTILSLPTT